MARLQGRKGGGGTIAMVVILILLLILAYVFLLAPLLDLPYASYLLISQ